MNSIINEARELYNQTIKDPSYAKSQIWNELSGNHADLMRIIKTCETSEEVIDELRKTDMYAIRIHDQRTFDLMMDWHRQNVPLGCKFVPDTPNLYKMAAYCESIYNAIGVPCHTVIELGGGNGQFARVAKHCLGMSQHIDIDIPESLYMAYVCTRHHFPNAKCYWGNPDIKFQSDADFIFIPVGMEYLIEGDSYDLFVNTASMGELPNEKIRYWMDFVQNKINVKYFYGFNRFLNTIDGNAPSGFSAGRKNENEASVLFDADWEPLKWEVEPMIARCPYEDPKIARYLEIFLKRMKGFSTMGMEGYLDNVKMEDWWRYANVDPTGTHRSNQLVNDFTMNGTLFKLWNAIRHGQKEAIPMMLQYFQHIGRSNLMFEEEFYYRRLL